jgi:hypothetical protein
MKVVIVGVLRLDRGRLMAESATTARRAARVVATYHSANRPVIFYLHLLRQIVMVPPNSEEFEFGDDDSFERVRNDEKLQ